MQPDTNKKKGRPVIHNYFHFDKKNFKGNSNRAEYNNFYELEAFEVIFDYSGDTTTKYNNELFEFFKINEFHFKKTILTQIGIIKLNYGIETATEIAIEICKKKMTTEKALSYCRRVKGKSKRDKVEATTQKLINVLNNEILSADEFKNVFEKFSNIINYHIANNLNQ